MCLRCRWWPHRGRGGWPTLQEGRPGGDTAGAHLTLSDGGGLHERSWRAGRVKHDKLQLGGTWLGHSVDDGVAHYGGEHRGDRQLDEWNLRHRVCSPWDSGERFGASKSRGECYDIEVIPQ